MLRSALLIVAKGTLALGLTYSALFTKVYQQNVWYSPKVCLYCKRFSLGLEYDSQSC